LPFFLIFFKKYDIINSVKRNEKEKKDY
jgi:hypothetical protein